MKLAGRFTPKQSSLATIAIGYCVGMQLAKIAPYVERIGAQYQISLTFVGWLASLLALFVAINSGVAARYISHQGALRALQVGLLIMALGAFLLGLVDGPWLMLAARGIEAIGYVLLVNAGPIYISLTAPAKTRGTYLALWGGFICMGYTLANLLAIFVPDQWSIGASLLVLSVPLVLAVGLSSALDDGAGAEKSSGIEKSRWQWPDVNTFLTALVFIIYVFLNLGYFTFLPALASVRPSLMLNPHLIGLFLSVGVFATAYALSGGRGDWAPRVAIAGLALAGLCAFGLLSGGLLGRLANVGYALGGGICVGAIFALVPLIARTPAQSARSLGILMQAAGASTLLSAPISGALIEYLGWERMLFVFAFLAFSAAGMIVYIKRNISAQSALDGPVRR